MKKVKKMLCLFLVSFLCTSMYSKVEAHTGDEVDTNEYSERAVEGIAPDDGVDYSGGSLTKIEIKDLKKHLNENEKIVNDQVKAMENNKEGVITPNHFNLWPHTHIIDSVGSSYDGYIDRGVVAEGKGDTGGRPVYFLFLLIYSS